MALRFRKSIKLAPGLRMNLSGSGVSWSLGPKGASVGIGRRGTYLNSSIPGTGLYSRQRLSGESASAQPTAKHRTTQVEITVSIADDGTLTFKDTSGNLIAEHLIEAAKKQQGNKIKALIQGKCNEINGQIEALGKIHEFTTPPGPHVFEPKAFADPKPVTPFDKVPGFFCKFFKSCVAKVEEEIRAGFDIEFEDENDRGSTHVEFTAACRKSGRKYSVEAKQKRVADENERFRLGRLLQRALKKSAKHTRVVFIGIGYLDAQDAGDGVMPARLSKALADLRGFEGRHQNGQPLPPAYLFVTNRPHDLALEDKHVQTTILAEGFQIPGFKFDTAFPSLRAAHRARKEHADMHQLLESMRVHSEIPTTFDGTPPELAFAGQTQRLIIGETYLVPDSKGVERRGKLTSATVNEAESKAYVAHYLDNGETVIGTVPLTPEALAAYRRHPDTFFGVEMRAPRKAETPLQFFDFIMDGNRDTPRERLLELMANNPDIEKLKTMSKQDLTEIYAEQFTWSIMRQLEKSSAK